MFRFTLFTVLLVFELEDEPQPPSKTAPISSANGAAERRTFRARPPRAGSLSSTGISRRLETPADRAPAGWNGFTALYFLK